MTCISSILANPRVTLGGSRDFHLIGPQVRPLLIMGLITDFLLMHILGKLSVTGKELGESGTDLNEVFP